MIDTRNSNLSIDKLIRFSKININEIYKILKTNINGISEEEARIRIQRYGPNIIPSSLNFIKENNKYLSCIRNKKERILSAEDITMGDIICLKEGDYIPADVRIISCNDFSINQYILTGENTIIKKYENIRGNYYQHKDITELDNICLQGAKVEKGRATVLVIAIGKDTYYSKNKRPSNKVSNLKSRKRIYKIKSMIKLLEI
ncbi:P-type ATPase [Clostridium chauvoei]|uniref:Uncharacterized protein n=2 Tax=Clostridium chauvoei TaxID=46867 RepID=A0ABD4RIL7_9CLOT|nr:cation-transporting P-type ATPase [Clostridium chauvoei]ATD54499.1 hypothetical protein BTM20_04315 [Clostridium chauvoei]ATD57818.1 hypothetical protein BTM21_08745 [Clostridium chauvoei]MBX7281047.1 hypothetical protein [Clostridium chauvoei]MBX7283566.1 hypothetical protein [Clostridium chauvoei]MBX7286020.1 hypothetical protein [Clostridium chauvoei]